MELLQETLVILSEHNKTPEDVIFCSIEKDEKLIGFSWNEFKTLAGGLVYDAGYGWNEIEMSLKVVGGNFWLERHEYDGSEWWEFKSIPRKPRSFKKPDSLLEENL